MASIKLGSRPKTFSRVVKFMDIDGSTEQSIEVKYHYRTRKQFAEMTEKRIQAALAEADAAEKEVAYREAAEVKTRMSVVDIADDSIKANADHLMDIMAGWDLDVPFDRSAVEELCDEYPGAAQAISQNYLAAIQAGHAGN